MKGSIEALSHLMGSINKLSLIIQALSLEPELREILAEAASLKNESGYDSISSYEGMKSRISSLVGWQARNPQLRTYEHYEAALQLIAALQPTIQEEEADEELQQFLKYIPSTSAARKHQYVVEKVIHTLLQLHSVVKESKDWLPDGLPLPKGAPSGFSTKEEIVGDAWTAFSFCLRAYLSLIDELDMYNNDLAESLLNMNYQRFKLWVRETCLLDFPWLQS